MISTADPLNRLAETILEVWDTHMDTSCAHRARTAFCSKANLAHCVASMQSAEIAVSALRLEWPHNELVYWLFCVLHFESGMEKNVQFLELES